MAWPTTKATTTHLDDQTDDPNLARPQIKQNIDNVNDIIDFFPSGQLISSPAYFTFSNSIPAITIGQGLGRHNVQNAFTLITAGGTGISVNTTDTYKLDMPAGSYFIETLGRGKYTIPQLVVGRSHTIALVKEVSGSDSDIQTVTVGNASSADSGLTGTYSSEAATPVLTDYFMPTNFSASVVYSGAGTLRMQQESSSFTGTLGSTPAITYDTIITFKITKYA